MVFEFTRVRFEGRWAHPRPLGSLGFALVVVGFIRVDWVTSCSSWEYLGLFGVVGFTQECTVRRSFHPGSLGSLAFALGVVGFIQSG